MAIYISFSSPVNADSTLLEPLSFGTIVVINNDSVGSITIEPDGDITLTGPTLILNPGQPALVRFSNLSPYTKLNITANVVQATTSLVNGVSEQFTLSNITTLPSVTTDALGTAIVSVGGTIETSGIGVGAGDYLDTTYTATFRVTINF
ncbi:MAG: hypothetical protein ACJA0T_000046 [Colwellia sp.]|jgi:hypothetical protein